MSTRLRHLLPHLSRSKRAGIIEDDPDAPQPTRGSKVMRRVARVLTITCWAYLALAITLWFVLRWTGDRWWVGTLLLFGPRWPWTLPLIVLIPAALLIRRRSIWIPLLCAAWVVVFPVMGLCLPWRAIATGAGSGPR